MRRLPAVDRVLQEPAVTRWLTDYGRDAVVDAVRDALDELRREIMSAEAADGTPEMDSVLARVQARLDDMLCPTLEPVINATGVILHTNLGRAPLSDAVLDAMRHVGRGYSNLEYDLEVGGRGSRYVHAEALLCRLTGAEAALLVNNNAGAVLLALSALARGREVIISRGQLVEIGGGFRIPDVMAQSGALLVEVGTTNRTYIADYERAIGEHTAALMRVHSSNFRIMGFSHQPSLFDLVALAHRRSLPLLDDLGSGTLIDTSSFGLPHEPTVQESVAAGADLVTFSGDKLLGGPQAGMIVGRADLVAELRRYPLTRALRVDKTTLAGIKANLLHYLKGEALTHIPIWRMIASSVDEIAERARRLLDALGAPGGRCDLVPGRSMIGGGSLPEESLPTMCIALPQGSAAGSESADAGANALARAL
ncbi:MAG TPA: L-seryl-tRNA(Sec) selenium transferase, partial [Chloroflexi bacterium]|nr:L-seryl-tRNA(Sec) selenium transferase [Chloroflexota bacterium]